MCSPFADKVGWILRSRDKLARSWLFIAAEAHYATLLHYMYMQNQGTEEGAPVPSNHCCPEEKILWKWKPVRSALSIATLATVMGLSTSSATEKLHFQFCLILMKWLHVVSVYSRCWKVAMVPYYENTKLINSDCSTPTSTPRCRRLQQGDPWVQS